MRSMAWLRTPLLVLFALFAGIAISAGPRTAIADEGWVINSFDIRYDVAADGTISAVETIQVDFRRLERRGIFRYFYDRVPCGNPVEGAQQSIYPCPSGSNRIYDYDIQSITRMDGSKWKYNVEDEGNGITTVRIGDADVFITGRQDYVITYTLKGAFDAYDDHDELYWNISGEWPVSITAFTATVVLPPGAETRALCYEGPFGSNEQCLAEADGNTIRYQTSRPLFEDEQVTIVAGWQRGIVEVGPPELFDTASVDDFFTFDSLEFLGLLGSILGGLGIVLASWWHFGRDRVFLTLHYLTNDTAETTRKPFSRRDVVVEFLPPEDLRPAQMGVLLDERADTLDVTATIVDLAVRGFLHITELEKKGWFGSNDWKLTKLKEAEDLNTFERKVFSSLFETGDEVELSDLKYKFAEDLAKAKDMIYTDAMKRKWFMQKPETARGMWVIVAIALACFGIGLSAFAALFWSRGLVFLGLIPAAILLLVLSRAMARRTAKGSEMLRRVLGFREYISKAETHMQRFNEQENIFARYLPYAIVFGCVTKWAEAFEGLEATAAASTSTFYTGVGAFHAASFSRDLQGFSSSVSSTLASTQSSSGGGSGFSGGGSSGGGGGGGGGGSW